MAAPWARFQPSAGSIWLRCCVSSTPGLPCRPVGHRLRYGVSALNHAVHNKLVSIIWCIADAKGKISKNESIRGRVFVQDMGVA